MSRCRKRLLRPSRLCFLLAALVLVAAVASACSSTQVPGTINPDAAGEPKGIATKASCRSSPTPATYLGFGEGFMRSYCVRCHSKAVRGAARNGAPDDHNFDSVDEIRALAEHIDEYAGSGPAATNERMPGSDPKPTLEERRKLAEWLACGAP